MNKQSEIVKEIPGTASLPTLKLKGRNKVDDTEEYAKGFADKCAEARVNAEVLLGIIQVLELKI